ncbi:MAG: type II toxin-antitoxin system RelE/ParE family toxin [Rhodothermales bacterium]|nr:type II toxin-antitoxin system RelE/ParE family toxin [Rhodothermales bacterium]MBO6780047.1 type II toxin-antitoxin system RelE/ParE family toxin [Rhodothermales bacterium]
MHKSGTPELRLSRQAERDLNSATAWYLADSRSAAASFVEQVEQAFRLILEFPNVGVPLATGYRRSNLQAFPYAVIYRVTSDAVEVLAVAHHRRMPGYWRGPEPEP